MMSLSPTSGRSPTRCSTPSSRGGRPIRTPVIRPAPNRSHRDQLDLHLRVRHRGSPDKMADQISDAILDAMLEQDPMSRVACETFVTTGLAIVGGEITTKGYVDIPKVVRATINEIGYNRESYGYDGNTVRRAGVARRAVARHRPGRRRLRRGALGHVGRGPAQQAGRRRPGDDVRLRLRRDRRAHAAADPPGPSHGRAPGRGAPGRHGARTCGPTARRRSPSTTTDGRPDAAAHGADLDPAQRRHRPRRGRSAPT